MNLYGGLEVARQMQQQQKEEGHVNLGLEGEPGGQEDSGAKDGTLGVSDLNRTPSVRLRCQKHLFNQIQKSLTKKVCVRVCVSESCPVIS